MLGCDGPRERLDEAVFKFALAPVGASPRRINTAKKRHHRDVACRIECGNGDDPEQVLDLVLITRNRPSIIDFTCQGAWTGPAVWRQHVPIGVGRAPPAELLAVE